MKNLTKISFFIVILIIVSVLLMLHKNLQAFIISSGSMETTIPTGSLVITQFIPPHTLQTGAIITFIPPLPKREFVTHRITEITQKNTNIIIKTKGDRNDTEDPWFLAGGGVIGKVVLIIPFLGFVFTFLQSHVGIIIFILLPAFFIIFHETTTIFNLIKKNKKSINIIFIMGAFFYLFIFAHLPIHQTNALLTDQATLKQNSILVGCDERHQKHLEKDKKIPCHESKNDHKKLHFDTLDNKNVSAIINNNDILDPWK